MINLGSDHGSFDLKFRLGNSVLEVSAKDLDKCSQKESSFSKTWVQVKLFALTGNIFNEKFVRSIIGNLKLDTLQKIDALQLKSLSPLVQKEIIVRKDKLIPLIEGTINKETSENAKFPVALKQKMDEWDKTQKQVGRTEWLFSEISREIEGSGNPEQVYKKYFGDDVKIPVKELASVASDKRGQISLNTRKISLLSVKQFRDYVKQKHEERLQSLYDEKLKGPIGTVFETHKSMVQDVNIGKDAYKNTIDAMKSAITKLFLENPELKELQEGVVSYFENEIIRFRVGVDKGELERRVKKAVLEKDPKKIAAKMKDIETEFSKNLTSFIATLEKETAQKLVADISETVVAEIKEGQSQKRSFLDISKEISQKHSLKGDSDFEKIYNVQLSMAIAQKAAECGCTPPSIKDMFADFSIRAWKTAEKGYTGYDNVSVEGQHSDDQKNLEFILAAHNQQYKDKVALTEDSEVGGIFEKIEVDAGTEIIVRADLHSDLRSLLAQLELFHEQGKLDDDYRCKDGFQMIFLGDYMDRGINDMEVMSLILKLRMENPGKVHLIRGNHEDIQQRGSVEKAWLSDREQEFTKCFKTFPLALFVGGPPNLEKNGRREYAHYSHGALSTLIDPIQFLEGTESTMVLKNNVEVSKAIKKISGQKVRLWSKFRPGSKAGNTF